MANRLPMMIVGRIIGVPDADIDKLTRWGYSATQFVEGLVTQDHLEAAGVSVTELSGYIAEQFQKAAANPQDNLLGDLATACATGVLDDVAALTMMITLFSAGGESTASLIGSAAWILAAQPDVQQQVRSQPGLIGGFLEEALRYEPPSVAITAMCSTTPSYAACNCRPGRVCSCYGVQPTVIRCISSTLISSDWIAQRPRGTSLSARASTSASEQPSPGWKLASCSVDCWNTPRTSQPVRPGHGCQACWCAASSTCTWHWPERTRLHICSRG